MKEIYTPELNAPVITVLPARRVAKRNSRSQKIFAETRSKRISTARLYLEPHHASSSSSPFRTVWQSAAGSSLRVPSPLSNNRRELWQEATPTTHTFPHIRPAHRRRLRPAARSKGSRLRRDWSQTLLSAYDAARAPFRHSPSLARRATHRRAGNNNNNNTTAQELACIRPPRPQSIRAAVSHAVEITGPLNSPTRSASFGKKLFRQRSFKNAHLSPPHTAQFPVNMPWRLSIDMHNRPQTSDAPVVPRRSPARCRDSFNRAKIHVRRPPKGTTHWFDALDEDSSDGDYPEVVEPPSSAPPGRLTFQPSLGPNRARAAPTSFVSQSSDLSADYFSYSHQVRSGRRRKNSALDSDAGSQRYGQDDLHSTSVLDLSSDDETPLARSPGWDMMTPSPGPHHLAYFRRGTMHRKGSANPFGSAGMRQSMASMQTTLTSGTIPFIMRISPMIDHPSTPPVPFLARHPASYLALTGRPPTADSISRSARSPTIRQSGRSQPSVTASVLSTANTLATQSGLNYVAVTSEEMAVLESMRRKRAAQSETQTIDSPPTNFKESITEEDEMPVIKPSPLNPKKQGQSEEDTGDALRSHSLASTVTLESGENLTFPTPPLPAKSPLLNGKVERGRNRSVPLNLSGLPTPPLTASYWSPEVSTPFEEVAELEAIPYSGPLPIRTSSNTVSTQASKRSSRCSLLRPYVFDGSQAGAGHAARASGAPSTPERSSGPRGIDERVSVNTAIRSPRRTRTFDNYDTTRMTMDFSHLQFSPVPNLLSPSLGGLLTSTTPAADWPGAYSPDIPSMPLSARSPSCISQSPSLTDGGSLSGRSRSELDTPIKEPSSHPRILCGDDSSPAGALLERLTGAKLTVVADVDGDDEAGGRYAIEIRKLAEHDDGGDGADKGKGELHHQPSDGEIMRKASTEVMDAWNALGGYPIH